jgi:hypothetical protein
VRQKSAVKQGLESVDKRLLQVQKFAVAGACWLRDSRKFDGGVDKVDAANASLGACLSQSRNSFAGCQSDGEWGRRAATAAVEGRGGVVS